MPKAVFFQKRFLRFYVVLEAENVNISDESCVFDAFECIYSA